MAEPDKYIVDLNEVISPDGTEVLPIQEAVGGDNTTFKISLSAIKSFAEAEIDLDELSETSTRKLMTATERTKIANLGTISTYNDAPADGNPYVRVNNQWVKLSDYLGSPL